MLDDEYKNKLMLNIINLYHTLLSNLDSTCVLIGLQVCFHSAMKHENDGSNMVASVSKL